MANTQNLRISRARIAQLATLIKDAHAEQSAALKAAFPLSSEWQVMIRSGQKTAKRMYVLDYKPGQLPAVRFVSDGRPKKFGYGQAKMFRRTVSIENIIGPV